MFLNFKSFTHIRQWILKWITKAIDFHAMVMVVAVWHIWDNRNVCRNGEALSHHLSVVGKIKAYIEFINLHFFCSTISIRHETLKSNQIWSPLSDGSIFVWTDASIFSQSTQAVFGVVIRDHLERVHATSRGYFA